jgi:hypothetical protein
VDKITFMKAALAVRPTTPKAKPIVTPPTPVVPFADWDYYYTGAVVTWKARNPVPSALSEVSVPEGFVTDLASVPRPFWSVLPPAARYSYPAIIHDYLYWVQPCDRAQADAVLKFAMEELQVGAAQIAAIYSAVRIGGVASWDANAAARNAGERRLIVKYPDNVLTTWAEWKLRPDVFAP